MNKQRKVSTHHPKHCHPVPYRALSATRFRVRGHGQVTAQRWFRESNDRLSVGQWAERADRGG